MSPSVAVVLGVGFVVMLFVRDRRLRPMTSGSLWIPFIWLAIVGSRPVSMWYGKGLKIEHLEDYLDGSPLDRNIYLLLIVVSLIILQRRGSIWANLWNANMWLIVYYVFCGISIFWSDYWFVSLKRWGKDVGTALAVLVILSEHDPIKALRAVLARYTYLAVVLSIILVKYLPEYGRYYNRWTWEPALCGIATNKNELGILILVCGIFLVWELLEMKRGAIPRSDIYDLCFRAVLLFGVLWLVAVADSSTARVCLAIGLILLVAMRHNGIRAQVRHLGSYTILLCVLAVGAQYIFSSLYIESLSVLGRDTTLTGRTELWADLMKAQIHPLFGNGYQSFWLGPFAQELWEKYSFHPIQAHNGFIETYLSTGLTGVLLLIAAIVAGGRRIKAGLARDEGTEALCLAFLAVSVVYNFTEALFNKLSPVWIVMLVAVINFPFRSAKDPSTLPAL